MLCVDVALPDAMRGEHLQEALEASDRLGIACVALTRDAADHRLAHDAGVAHALRKPFETGEAERLLPQETVRDLATAG